MLGYLGPKGTFSHQAAKDCANGEELREYRTINAVIKAVDGGEIERGIVPIENSIEGAINTTLDMLAFDVNLYITGEYVLHISQNLMIKRGADISGIKLITSHPQPIGQCSHMLNTEFKDIKTEYADSTAAAAERVARSDGSVACIASKASADLYGLEIARADCGDDKSNSTRFVIVEREPSKLVTDDDKTSIAFTLENKPGSLYSALELFSASNVNMTKIESRPIKTHLGTYVFFIDIDGNIDNASIYFALDKLRRGTEFYKFLGSYKKA
ncbi:MAG: prephenate dehydratase [Firmicutes bacterium]|nr:prephenate dehydratase [Bacillota bacterium]